MMYYTVYIGISEYWFGTLEEANKFFELASKIDVGRRHLGMDQGRHYSGERTVFNQTAEGALSELNISLAHQNKRADKRRAKKVQA